MCVAQCLCCGKTRIERRLGDKQREEKDGRTQKRQRFTYRDLDKHEGQISDENRAQFEAIDSDRSERLDAAELERLMKDMGFKTGTAAQALKIIAEVSRRGRSLPVNASGFDPHRASISSRFGQARSTARPLPETERLESPLVVGMGGSDHEGAGAPGQAPDGISFQEFERWCCPKTHWQQVVLLSL
jgi:hypothetical protein